MDLRKLRIFAAVADQGSFTAAAEQLHMAQPAVSVALRKLEQELGLLLLHRHERGAQLTGEGRVLRRHCHRIFAAVREAELEMAEIRGLAKGEVRIGIPSMLGSYYFPEILMGFKARYPSLNLSVQEAGARDIQRLVHAGKLDMGIIVRDQLPEDLEAQTFLREEMVACVPAEHPFASRASVTLEEFFAEELVLFKPGYFHREVIDSLAKTACCTPKIAFETDLIPLIRAIVRKGYGVTTFLRMVVEDDPALAACSFEKPVWLDLCIAWKRGGYLSHADRCFKTFLLEQTDFCE